MHSCLIFHEIANRKTALIVIRKDHSNSLSSSDFRPTHPLTGDMFSFRCHGHEQRNLKSTDGFSTASIPCYDRERENKKCEKTRCLRSIISVTKREEERENH